MKRQIIPSLITLSVIFCNLIILCLAVSPLRAQYSSSVATLKEAEDLYDERGYEQGKALSVDGHVAVSESNGNLSYVYPISTFSKNGYTITTSLNYCGSVAFTTFDRYVVAHNAPGYQPCTPYEGWQKFHQNRPAWIIGVNGFAVQMLSTATHFTHPPNRRAGDASRTVFNDSDCVWLADGYDFCNRMSDYGAKYSDEQIGQTYVDNISLLRADGSVLELLHATEKNATNPDQRPEVYTGYYIPAEANSSAFAVVEYDSTYMFGQIAAIINDSAYAGSRYPLLPRVCRYYPGDGTCFTFREKVAPFGIQAYRYYDSATGGFHGGPTIFYLEEISSAAGPMVDFMRSRHYPVWYGTLAEDSSRGRALLTSFEGHTFSYGSNSVTIQAFGRTTTVKFTKVSPSGNANETTWMPIGRDGYYNWWAVTNSTLPEGEPYLYRSHLGYVTEIDDPVGRKTNFTYESYARKYINFGYLRSGGGDITVRLANLRMKTVTEPTAKYTIYYYKKTPDLDALPAFDAMYLSSGNDTLSIRNGDDQDTMAQKVTNIVAAIDKYDKHDSLLATDRYRFQYENHTTFAEHTVHLAIDQVSHDTVATEYFYKRFWLPKLLPTVPTPRYTGLTSTVTTGAGVHTVEDVYYGAQDGSTSLDSITVWGTTYHGAASTLGTPFLILDTARRVTINDVEKSYQSTSYTLDTARTYGGDAGLTRLIGLDIATKTTRELNPSTHAVRLAQTTDFTHLPYIDTIGTEIYAFLRKLEVKQRWDSLKELGEYDPSIKWEEAMFDPRIALWNYDTVSSRVLVPPHYRIPHATSLRDSAGALLAGMGSLLHTAFNPLWDSSYANRGLPLIDTVIGAGGSARIITARHDYDRRRPSVLVDANGSTKRLSYDYSFPEYPDIYAEDFPWPYAKLFDDRDSSHQHRLHSPVYGNFTEQPMATRDYVRHYDPSTLTLDTAMLENHFERDFYGLVSGVVDPNGWYTERYYDPNGRLTRLWLPGDFQSPDSVYKIEFSGWDSSETNGSSAYHQFSTWVDCRTVKDSPLVDTYTPVYTGEFYVDDPIIDVPSCPPCGETREKGGGRSVQALCTTPIQYEGTTPAIGTARFGVMPGNADSIETLDSAYLKFTISSIVGECLTLKMTIPSLGMTKYFLFNCGEDSYEGGGGGGAGTGTKEKGGGRSVLGDTIFAGTSNSLKIDLTSKKSDLLAMQGEYMDVTFEMETPGGRIEFVSGYDAEDQRPRLMMKGDFRETNYLADYTLAYSHYDDIDPLSYVHAKVDDHRHTANVYDSITVGDRRETSAQYTFGADNRLLETDRYITEDSGLVTRTDTSLFAYTGMSRRTKATDPEKDTSVNAYDAFGRVVQTTNADGTHTTASYAYGTPSSFGITDQDFYGFATSKTVTNENGTKFTQFTDAFDRLRREITDSGSTGSSSTHFNLITRYEYDVQGRLTQVINPKGDTTKYAYDDFGRLTYKYQPDIGTISYAYDNAGNARFSQTQEQAQHGRLAFTEYDDLNRPTVIGEAVLGTESYNEDTILVATGGSGSFPPSGRLTSTLDPTHLHTGGSTILTANKTIWSSPGVAVPAASPSFGIVTCSLPPNADLGETSAPVGPFLRRPAVMWRSNPPIASCDTNSFEHIGNHPEFVRIAVAYDTLPDAQGSVWQAMPLPGEWDQLAPHGAVRNLKGHEAAVAYRERGCEPFHYVVQSYDERGRVEALLRYTENLGFDAVYYDYNAMNKVTCVRVADPIRQYATWYGYDPSGRIDSVWSYLSGTGGGVLGFFGFKYVGPPLRPDTADIVYRYTKTGQLQTMQYPPVNVLVTYAYDHRKWLDSLVSTKSGSPLFREILSYDPSGQITKQIWKQGTSSREEQDYSYDSLARLTGWTQGPAGGSPTSTTNYSYDNVGNRLDVTSGSTTLEQYTITTGKNRLESHRQIPTIGYPIRSDYGYNANGSAVERTQVEDRGLISNWQETDDYGYSFRELMKRYKVATPGPLNTTTVKDWRYRYSAGGEREQKRQYPYQWGDTDIVYPWVYYALGANKEQLAVYHGQQLVNMYCATDTVPGRRVYFYPSEYITNGVGYTGVPEQLGQVITKPTATASTKEYRVSDHLASLRASVEGATTRTLNYDPWGTPLSGSSSGERSTFNDQEKDLENGLYDLSDRNFNAVTGRFTKVDRLWETSCSTSPYVYCGDNPLRLTDPTGMQARSIRPLYRTVDLEEGSGGGGGGASSANNVAVAAAEGYVIRRGYADAKAGTLRQEYINRVSGLSTDESAMRTAIKENIRIQTPADYRAIAEAMRPISAEGTRIAGTANKTNAAVDELMPRIGTMGKVTVGVGIAMSAYHVATADDKPRAVAQEAGGWAGAITGGEIGAEAGAAIGACFGGAGAVPGAIIGGIVGSIAGAIAGSEVADKTYESVTGK